MSAMLKILVLASAVASGVHGFALPTGVSPRVFMSSPKMAEKPKLILIGGSPGTGKSTFGMSVALDQGILKCISTDTVRAVMRSFVGNDISPALHRSSYAAASEGDDPVRSWKETCTVLGASVEGLVEDAINRGQSLVVEGVHVVPSTELINRWEESGGVAIGCMLTIQDPEAHKTQLRRRGLMTGKESPEETKIASFDRIRAIQDEMMRLADDSHWLKIEQRIGPDPLDLVSSLLYGEEECVTNFDLKKPKSEPQISVKKDHKAGVKEKEQSHATVTSKDHKAGVKEKEQSQTLP